MKKLLVILMLVLGVNVFADYTAVELGKRLQDYHENKSTNTNNTREYNIVGVAVAFKDIDNIDKKGVLVIQDIYGRFYMYGKLHGKKLYNALLNDDINIDVDYLDYIDVSDYDELYEMAERNNGVIVDIDNVLKIIRRTRKY